jgi:hypothetical protein
MAEEIWEVIPQGLKPLVIPAHFGTAKEVAEKGIVGGEMDPAGAKAHLYYQPFAARLKSCPDTKPSQIAREGSFSAGCKVVP